MLNEVTFAGDEWDASPDCAGYRVDLIDPVPERVVKADALPLL